MSKIIFSIFFFLIGIYFSEYGNKNKIRLFLDTFLFFVFTIINEFYFVSYYFTGNGFDERMIATLKLGISNAGFSDYKDIFFESLTFVVFIIAVALFHFKRLGRKESIVLKRLGFALIIFSFVIHPLFYNVAKIHSQKAVKQSKDFYNYYKKPDLNNLDLTKLKNNLVVIYLESFERTYFNKDLFPGLAPNLSNLIKNKGIEFTNVAQIPGSGFTTAGMTCSQCGLPLFVPSHYGNAISGIDEFFPDALCIGDILKKAGYYLSFIQGSSVSFSAIEQLYKTHSFDSVKGKKELLPLLKDKNYQNPWGLYDDSLLEIAYENFINMAKTKDKFAMFLATIDTHPPKGFLSKSCEKEVYRSGANSILNCFKCTDKLVSKFIKKIMESKYGENTVIVILSDHLAMRNTSFFILNKAKKRRNLFVIFDPKEKKHVVINKPATPLDIAPTVLYRLGIDIDLGLGRNLFCRDSLSVKFKNFDEKLYSWSDSILKFWNLPSFPSQIEITPLNKQIYFSGHTYKIPILIYSDGNSNKMAFEENNLIKLKKLYKELLYIKNGSEFLWIDNSSYVNFIFNTNVRTDYCLVYGKLGSKLKIVPIKGKEALNLKDCTGLLTGKVNSNDIVNRVNLLSKQRGVYFSSLKKGIIFENPGYPEFIKEVKGFVFRRRYNNETFGIIYKNVKLIFKHKLPHNFILEFKAKKFGYGKNSQTLRFKIGNQEKKLEIKRDVSVYTISFMNVDADSIEIIPSNGIDLKSIFSGNFRRKSKIGLLYLKIKDYPKDNKVKKFAIDRMRFIAHAGGAIKNKIYTDSLDALNENYKKGFRLFELDIIKTSDGHYVAAHDWKHWKKITGYQGNIPVTLQEFRKHKIMGEFTPLDMSMINEWFLLHKDAILVTDKVNNPKDFSSKFVDKHRLMMELFSLDAIEEALKEGIYGVMPTFAVLRRDVRGDILEYLKKRNIRFVAASRNELHNYLFFLKKLHDNGIKIYAFNLNAKKGYDETYMICNELDYFYGIYADNWDFNNPVKIKNCDYTKFRKQFFYHSTLEEGIYFRVKGYPDIIVDMQGISIREKWGRWSDARLNSFVNFCFKNKLPENFTLELVLRPFGPNLNKKVRVKAGNIVKFIKLTSIAPQKYTIEFENVKTDTIEIYPPKPISPKSLNYGRDNRLLSIGFISLKIIKKPK